MPCLQLTLRLHNNCPHPTSSNNSKKHQYPKLQHESPVLLVERDKETIGMRRGSWIFFAVNKEWQMEREAEDVESACNINKNKELWEVCVCSCSCKPSPEDKVSLNRYAC